MDCDEDYFLVKRIVQSGLSVVEWDGLRTSPGLWPTDDRASWKRYRNYSVEELKTLMDKYKLNGVHAGHDRSVGNKSNGSFASLAGLDYATEQSKVTVRVPASSANLGPGFDAIGMAVDIWSEYTIERSDRFEVVIEGVETCDVPLDETNLVCRGVSTAFKHAGKPLPSLKYTLVNAIPHARGLGSSSAAIVGGLLAGLVLAGHAVNPEDVLNMAADIEGHPDNVAPAIYGGIQLALHTGERWLADRVNLPPDLHCICFIPNATGQTATARAVLTDSVPRADAVFNIARVAWLVNALWTQNTAHLRYGVQDALHQPQRAAAVYPHLEPVIRAALSAGACAAYLSGAGPTVMALSSANTDLGSIPTATANMEEFVIDREQADQRVAEAMRAAAVACQVEGDVVITAPVAYGVHVVSAAAIPSEVP